MMTEDQKAEYHALCAKMFARTLSPNEEPRLKALAEMYKEVVKAEQEAHVADTLARQQIELAAKREEAEKAKREEEILHQISYFKSVLNPKVDDDALKAAWLSFRSLVGDP
jgi:hypothetical protein